MRQIGEHYARNVFAQKPYWQYKGFITRRNHDWAPTEGFAIVMKRQEDGQPMGLLLLGIQQARWYPEPELFTRGGLHLLGAQQQQQQQLQQLQLGQPQHMLDGPARQQSQQQSRVDLKKSYVLVEELQDSAATAPVNPRSVPGDTVSNAR